jgi:hypothetical protein
MTLTHDAYSSNGHHYTNFDGLTLKATKAASFWKVSKTAMSAKIGWHPME